MNIEQQQSIVGDRIDTLIALDISARGVIGQLYAMARDQCNAPLCLQAARKLKNALVSRC